MLKPSINSLSMGASLRLTRATLRRCILAAALGCSGANTPSAPTDDGVSGSQGCGLDAANLPMSLQVANADRSFTVHVPDGYDSARAYPLIVALHGGGGSGASFQQGLRLDSVVGSEAIIVYPDGLPEFPGGDTVWALDPEGDDFIFFDALLSHMQTHMCLDESRVFATGWSLGGYMANSLGCYRSERVTAIASISGGVPGPKPPAPPYAECTASVPARIMHGTNDFVIPISEGEAMRDIFAANSACDLTTTVADPAPCVAYEACSQPLHWCEYSGGHEWPSFAAEGVWGFFSAQ